MGYDRTRFFYQVTWLKKKTPGKTPGLGEDENPVKLQQTCTC